MGMFKLHKCPSCWDNPCTCHPVYFMPGCSMGKTVELKAGYEQDELHMSFSSSLTMTPTKIEK